MIRNIIFDFGQVLVDWNPHYLFDPYFGDADKAAWFLDNICTILYWCFSFWLTSLCIIGSSFIHLIRTDSNVFFLMAE